MLVCQYRCSFSCLRAQKESLYAVDKLHTEMMLLDERMGQHADVLRQVCGAADTDTEKERKQVGAHFSHMLQVYSKCRNTSLLPTTYAMQAKEALVEMQAQLHAMQAELNAVVSNSSATAKVTDFTYRRIPAFSELYSHLILESISSCMRPGYLCWFTCDMQGRGA